MVLVTEACMALTVGMMGPLLDKLHSFLKPSDSSSTSPSTSHDSETTDSVPYIVHIGKEAQCGVSAAVHACDMKMLSVACQGFQCQALA